MVAKKSAKKSPTKTLTSGQTQSAKKPSRSTTATGTLSKREVSKESGPIRWTIMLYIAADSILANFAIESLKQLRRSIAASQPQTEICSVTVAAQLMLDAPGGQQIPRYIFDAKSPDSLAACIKENYNAPDSISEEGALIDFLNWVYKHRDKDTDRYALILWGHGPYLLLQPPPGAATGSAGSLYLTPEELRRALEQTKRPDRDKLELIAFDACSMSMFEMAYELQNLAEYMVASQEEVPDPSFPYDSLVDLFRRNCGDTEALLKEGVQTYVNNYQDYISNGITGMKSVTLSALRLSACGPLTGWIQKLAQALLKARCNPELPRILITARAAARDYVSGLYVDLFEFCSQLYWQVLAGAPVIVRSGAANSAAAKNNDWRAEVASACAGILDALKVDINGTSEDLILATCSADARSHGVSLYLPYLSEDQYANIVQPMVKGGRDTVGKGLSVAINSASSGLLMCERHDLIVLTEGYYEELKLTPDTDWYTFISEQWTNYLIDAGPAELDYYYSAQQSAANISRAYRKQVCPYKKLGGS